MTEENNSFSYNICGNSAVVIVNLHGTLSSGCIDILQGLHQAILAKSDLKSVILNFSEVESLSHDIIPTIAQLQKSIRDNHIHLRMCSMKLSLKEKLGKAGILRNNEISEDSKAAIYSLTLQKARSA